MSDGDIEVSEVAEDELTNLKQRADQMGINYHPSIGVEKLRDKVSAALNDTPPEARTAAEPKEKKKMSEADKIRLYHTRLRHEALKLIRVRITCMNPNKKNYPGEILSVSNAVIGTVKKFIPFNSEEGYHIPAVLLKMLKDRKYQHYSQITLANGQKKAVPKLLPEFAIEEMAPLTAKELDELKQRQISGHSID